MTLHSADALDFRGDDLAFRRRQVEQLTLILSPGGLVASTRVDD